MQASAAVSRVRAHLPPLAANTPVAWRRRSWASWRSVRACGLAMHLLVRLSQGPVLAEPEPPDLLGPVC